MKVWSFCIAATQSEPDKGEGFVVASSPEEALRLIGHPDANIYPCPDDAFDPRDKNPLFLHPRS